MAEVAVDRWARHGARRKHAPTFATQTGTREPTLRAWARNMLVARTDASMAAIGASPVADTQGGSPRERQAGLRLDKLAAHGWRVLHSIPIGTRAGDVDQILIGPGGVFCIRIHNYARARVWVSDKVVWVDGESQPHLRYTQVEGERASRMLTRATGSRVAVQPVLVVVGDRYRATNHRRDVRVLARRDMPKAFRRLPTIYSAEDVATIYEAARRSETWV